MSVDIIIPFWNNIALTSQCVRSVLQHTLEIDFRIILVDDGSIETMDTYLDEVTKTDKVRLLNIPHGGFIKATNAGLKESKADYVVLLNNDTVIEDSFWLKKMMAHFDNGVGAVGATSNYVCGRQKVEFNEGHISENTKFLIGFCMMVSREVIDKVGILDEQFGLGGCDDIDWSIRIRDAGYSLRIARDVFIKHIGTQSFTKIENYNPDDYWARNHPALFAKHTKDKVIDTLNNTNFMVIGLPTWGYISSRFFTNFFALRRPSHTAAVVVSRGVVHLARNEIVRALIKSGAEYLFFLDDDMIIPPETISRLLSHNQDVVCAMTFKRGVPYEPCAFNFDPHTRAYQSIAHHQGLVQVDGCGMACTLIKRKVLETLKDPWFKFAEFGEDLQFCHEVKKAGFKIACDTDLCTGHIGEQIVVDHELCDNWHRVKEGEAKNESNVVCEVK